MTQLRQVRIVGAGLLGTSIGLALTRAGVDVTLTDISPVTAALAADMRAGRPVTSDDDPDLIVVAAPPDVVADIVVDELRAYPRAIVTDVASVKAGIVESVRTHAPGDAERYVGGHPMAGRERSGAVAAQSDLFSGRTWVITPDESSPVNIEGAAMVAELARICGARVVQLQPADHDRAVAAVSHLPQLAASAVAKQLCELPEDAVALAGQGVRDVTRIAASDPLLWTQILSGNAEAVLPFVDGVIEEFTTVRAALATLASADTAPASAGEYTPGPRAVIAQAIAQGQDGQARIPGKHGAPRTNYTTVAVIIPDEPGALGRVFTDAGQSGVSIEDMRIEHDTTANQGLLELDVLPVRAETLHEALVSSGWQAHLLATH